MKKITLGIAVLYSINLVAQQSFEKKSNVVAFGADLGIYNYVTKVASNKQSDVSTAANKMLSLHYERGVSNWLGIGAKVLLSDYFTSKDTITNSKPSITGLDATILVNAHFLRTKRVDVLAGFNFGYSTLNWEARDQYISAAKGGGLIFDFHLQPRFYFGDHIGMFINLAYVNYSYKDLYFKNTVTNIPDVLDLTGAGVNFGFGFQGKF
jgi:hypothetical protein